MILVKIDIILAVISSFAHAFPVARDWDSQLNPRSRSAEICGTLHCIKRSKYVDVGLLIWRLQLQVHCSTSYNDANKLLTHMCRTSATEQYCIIWYCAKGHFDPWQLWSKADFSNIRWIECVYLRTYVQTSSTVLTQQYDPGNCVGVNYRRLKLLSTDFHLPSVVCKALRQCRRLVMQFMRNVVGKF